MALDEQRSLLPAARLSLGLGIDRMVLLLLLCIHGAWKDVRNPPPVAFNRASNLDQSNPVANLALYAPNTKRWGGSSTIILARIKDVELEE